MTRNFPSLVLLAMASFSSAAFASGLEGGPSVTLPLEQYLDMKKQLDTPSVSTIEEVRLSGDMKTPATLTITLSGASSGHFPAVDVLEQSDAYSLSSCNGPALFQAHDGVLALLPQKNRFTLECKLVPKVSAEIPLTILNALSVRNQVAGAELVVRSATTERRELILARLDQAKGVVAGPVTTSGHYRLSAYPDDTRFEYRLTFFNPNRTSQAYELELRNHETVQDVRTTLVYEQAAGTVTFKLTPGESVATVTGKLPGGSFTPPLESSQQFLLLENHPLLQLAPETKARRISLDEAGVAPTFPGALAFLLDTKDRLAWKTRKLAVFESQGYTVGRADYRYYVPNRGVGIVEADFEINNRGTPELALNVPGKASYLEIDGVAQALYKDDGGKLLVHFPSGRHRLLVQYRPEKPAHGVAGRIHETLLKPDAVISDVNVTVLLADGWNLLFGRTLSDFRTSVTPAMLGFGALVFILYLLLFTFVELTPRARWLAAIGAAAVALTGEAAVVALVALWALMAAARVRRPAYAWLSFSWKRILAAFGAVLTALLAIFVFSNGARYEQSYKADSFESAGAAREGALHMMAAAKRKGAPAPMAAAPVALSGGANAQVEQPTGGDNEAPPESGEAFQGIPARLKLPQAQTAVSFRQSLVEADSAVTFSAGLVSHRLLMLLAALLGLLALGIATANRGKFVAYLR